MAGRHRKSRQSHRGRHRKPPQRQRIVIPAVAGVAVLSAGSVALASAVGGASSPRHPAASAGSVVVRSVPLPSFPVPPRTSQTTSTPATKPVHHATAMPPVLLIDDVHGPCYVQVSRRGTVLTRTILRQGKHLVFRRHGLDVVLGNAGAVRMRISGHHAIRPGAFGQVRVFRVH